MPLHSAIFQARARRDSRTDDRRRGAAVGNEPPESLTLAAGPGATVMRSERARGRIDPAVFSRALISVVQWIMDLVFGFRLLADHDQAHLFVRVVQEGVADPCPGREPNTVTRLERMQDTIDPRIGSAFDDEDEFLFRTLGMRVADAPTRRYTHMMDTDARQAEPFAQRRIEAHLLLVAAILIGLGLFESLPVGDEVGARHESPARF